MSLITLHLMNISYLHSVAFRFSQNHLRIPLSSGRIVIFVFDNLRRLQETKKKILQVVLTLKRA